ncbi:MAG: sialate O-acetylesterase, partial [Planctomycetales bacterium]|nr:sialate O-acetylesterase [Planctomycetales bacterium]
MRASLAMAMFGLMWLPTLVRAELTLPAVFSDHMVLQRDKPVKIWGWATAGKEVTGRFASQQFATEADAEGRWTAILEPMKAGGPFSLTVAGDGSTAKVEDVYVGEVWLCSGQSNMAMTVNRAANFEQEAAAAKFPQIRMFKESSAHATEPQEKPAGSWTVCSPETVAGFSATAYFFGRELHQELGVPVGLVNSSVGGTSIESWTSMPAQVNAPGVQPRLQAWRSDDEAFDADAAQARYEQALKAWEKRRDAAKAAGTPIPRRPAQPTQPRQDRNYPSNLFNGKINPLVGYTIRGAIWYQGENNAGRGYAHVYEAQLRTLIGDWRTRWGQGDFPFAWVQLPNFRAEQREPSETSGWVLVQEAMLKTLAVPHTGMAITIDIGEANDIHPRNKQDVGKRLALWALHDVYEKDVVASGPVFKSARRDGNQMVIEFDHVGEGLKSRESELTGFAIAGKDREFHWAEAKIDGPNRVIVSSPSVPEPAAVRYAWAANPR